MKRAWIWEVLVLGQPSNCLLAPFFNICLERNPVSGYIDANLRPRLLEFQAAKTIVISYGYDQAVGFEDLTDF